MAAKEMQMGAPPMPRWVTIVVWTFALGFPLFAVSQQSFWIDEAITGNAARERTVLSGWQSLRAINGSDLQMPFYMFYAWAWEKLFGASEISLRLANYPWFVLGQVALAGIWQDARKRLLVIIVAACNAHLWFYMNEARPYIMQFGSACVLAYFLSAMIADRSIDSRRLWLFGAAALILAGASMLGALWVASGAAPLAYLAWRKKLRVPWVPVITVAAMLVALGFFYLWTLSFGARATVTRAGILNAPFVAYELAGFAGLGPGRNELRESGLTSFRPFLLPLILYAIALLGLLLRALPRLARPQNSRVMAALAVFALAPLPLLLIAGAPMKFSVLGRHAIAALPFICVLLSLGAASCLDRKTVPSRAVLVLFFVLAVSSCLGFRFAPWHAKDDYRGAAAVLGALPTTGKTIWWVASNPAGTYYRLPLTRENKPEGPVVLVRDPTTELALALPQPSFVFLSRPDLYDERGTVAAMLKREGFVRIQTLRSFTIWQSLEERSALPP